MPREAVVKISVCCDCVDHDCHLGDTPTKDERTDAQVVLDTSTEQDEAAYVERNGDVADPVGIYLRPQTMETQKGDMAYHSRLSASNTP